MVQRICVPPSSPAEAVSAASAELQNGRTVILPTDTVYGIAAHPLMPEALEEIYCFKNRERGKPVALLASDRDAVARLAGRDLTPPELRLADACWPGALTLILNAGEDSEAVRVPDHALAREVIASCGGLLRVTSANLSGDPEACDGDAAAGLIETVISAADYHGNPPLLIDNGVTPGGVPSSVVRVDDDRLTVFREGAITADELNAIAFPAHP